jgi:site-specific DNA-methyltransferase (adenine-specific)
MTDSSTEPREKPNVNPRLLQCPPCANRVAVAEMNRLYYGDNLRVLREEIADASVDLIYLDPPFNSQASYNVLFKGPRGDRPPASPANTGSRAGRPPAQVEAFTDTWQWCDEAERAFDEVIRGRHTGAAELLRALRAFLRDNDLMAYLAMMAVRLVELHRVLKPSGSLYLHCDPTASHYLKALLDSVFGPECFRNEIIWKRTTAHSDTKSRFSHVTDTILFYACSRKAVWNPRYKAHSEKYLKSHYRYTDAKGRIYRLDNIIRSQSMGHRPNLVYEYNGFVPPYGWRVVRNKLSEIDRNGKLYWSRTGTPYLVRYLDEQNGEIIDNLWDDIPPLNSQAQERLGYPTQKPLALLERIIAASSNQGDVVLDPFCGCGTAVHAAQKLGRRWVGIDITHLAIALIERRMKDAFPGVVWEVRGTPKDLAGAAALAARDKYQFQWWVLSLLDAVPGGPARKKGADGGIDGVIWFRPDARTTEKAIVSVKGGGHLQVSFVRELAHVVERDGAKLGVLVTLVPPTAPMRKEAAGAGVYTTAHGSWPKIQIVTVEDLLAGHRPRLPWPDPNAFRRAARERAPAQPALL